MRQKKAKALRRHARRLADRRPAQKAENPDMIERIVQKVVRTVKGHQRIERSIAIYPSGHPRRIYQDLKKGSKGVPIRKLCVI